MARKVNAEIAVRLGISSDGVKYHVSNMLGKLGLETREELAAWKPGRERVSFVRSFFAAPAASKWTGLGVAATVAGGAVLVAGLWGLRGSAEDTSDWFANGAGARRAVEDDEGGGDGRHGAQGTGAGSGSGEHKRFEKGDETSVGQVGSRATNFAANADGSHNGWKGNIWEAM